MNCKNVEPLLSLYVGGDLDQEQWRAVGAHLQDCAECTRVVAEYAAASQLLQRYEPPFFSDEIYAGIRRQVLNDLEQKSRGSARSNIFSALFSILVQPRLRWITAALLLATSLTALYLSRNPAPQSQNDREVAVATPAPAPGGSKTDVRSRSSNEAAGLSSRSSKDEAPVAIRRGPIKRRANGVVANNLAGELAQVPRVNSQPSSAPAPVRLEMQTSDRNIRIIWLSGPRPPAGGSDGSKGI
jgi:anti-sigma factor RsiW